MKLLLLNRKSILSLFLALFFLSSCHDTITVIKGCCEEPPISGKVGTGHVYVPNVFTPNGDQWHDQMTIYGDSMQQILHLEIRTRDNVLVYENDHIPLDDLALTWDGTVNGRVERGLYGYELRVEALDGYVKTFKGHICNCPCDQMSDEDIIPIRNCEFGICDPWFIDCDEFEYLPCFEH